MKETQSPSAVRRILIADDDQTNRELLRNMLQQMTTAELHLANDGAAALALYNELRPQLVFLDIDMPEMDGFAVLETIRLIEAKAYVVMVSGHSSADAVKKALEHGVNGYIVKPYTAQRVFDALHRYVGEVQDLGFLRA